MKPQASDDLLVATTTTSQIFVKHCKTQLPCRADREHRLTCAATSFELQMSGSANQLRAALRSEQKRIAAATPKEVSKPFPEDWRGQRMLPTLLPKNVLIAEDISRWCEQIP